MDRHGQRWNWKGEKCTVVANFCGLFRMLRGSKEVRVLVLGRNVCIFVPFGSWQRLRWFVCLALIMVASCELQRRLVIRMRLADIWPSTVWRWTFPGNLWDIYPHTTCILVYGDSVSLPESRTAASASKHANVSPKHCHFQNSSARAWNGSQWQRLRWFICLALGQRRVNDCPRLMGFGERKTIWGV
jgi:hypothetical protein